MSETLFHFDADDFVNIGAGTSYAAKSVVNEQYVLSYQDGFDQAAYFRNVFPRQANTGNMNVNLHWSNAGTGNTGSVAWRVEFERHVDGTTDLSADGFATGKTVLDTANTVNLENVCSFSVTPAEMNNVAAGENFRFRVSRISSNTGDNLAGTAHFRSVELWQ